MLENEKLVAILSGGNWVGGSVDFLVLPDSVNVSEVHATQQQLCPKVPLEKYLREACHGRYAESGEVEIYAEGINPKELADRDPNKVIRNDSY
jgi:hypothetical protein